MASYQGTAGNDAINGTGGADSLRGNGGDDSLYGGGGNDVIDGGAGTDSARYRGSFLDYTITWDAAVRQYRIIDRTGRDGIDMVSGVEYFRFTDGTWSIANLVEGIGDGLILNGTAGDDVLTGGIGYDRLDGGAGNDLLEGVGSEDVLAGGSGTDSARFSGNFLDYRITWDANARKYTIADQVVGRDGTDTVSGVEYFGFADGLRAISDLGLAQGDGEILIGADGDDVLAGNVGYDVIDGGAGNDMLEGAGGDDAITGGAGWDAVRFSGSSWEYSITWDAATRQYTVADNHSGRDGTDVVGGVEVFQFQDGYRDWSNLVYGVGDGVNLVGTDGADVLEGSMGYDTLQGGQGDDILNGYAANDVIDGGIGNDMLEGGRGNDALSGGEGVDTVRFSGSSWEYNITWDAATRQYTVADNMYVYEPFPSPRYVNRDGSDTVSGVEIFQFQDGYRDWSNLVYGAGDGVTVVGTEGADTLEGSMGYDTLQGGEGNDMLYGQGAGDVLDGGGADDFLDAGAGNDELQGGAGNDMLRGGEGNDVLVGGDGVDMAVFSGSIWEYSISWDAATRQYTIADNTSTYTSYPWPQLASRDGTDTLSGVEIFQFQDGYRNWSDLVYGAGDGFSLVGTEGADMLEGSPGYDTLQGGDGNDMLYGFASADSLDGGAGEDMLDGGLGADQLEGGSGGDWLRGDEGNDVLVGGHGLDTAVFSGSFWEYSVTWDAATRQYTIADNTSTYQYYPYPQYASRDGTDTTSGVELFQFQDVTRNWSDLVFGAGDGFSLVGTDGSDYLEGSVGYDTLQGGDGNDMLYGFASADSLEGGAGEDMLDGGLGADQLLGGSGGDWLRGDEGNDVLVGGDGLDTAVFSGSFWEYSVTWDAATRQYTIADNTSTYQYYPYPQYVGRDGTDTVSGVELFQFQDGTRDWSNLVYGAGDGVTVAGTEGDDYLYGSQGYDTLQGGDGWDHLYGMAGGDVIEGGAGSDVLEGGAGNDHLDGGADDFDWAYFSGYSWEYSISWDAVARQYTIADNNSNYYYPYGSRDGVDTLQRVEYVQFQDGYRDWSNLVMGAGEGVELAGTDGDDDLYGSTGYDVIHGGAGNDRVYARESDDAVYGEAGDDWIDGHGGNDFIDGGEGLDTVSFAGYSYEFNISYDAASGRYTFAHQAGSGTDTLTGVEYVSFSDGLRPIESVLGGSWPGQIFYGTTAGDYLVGSGGDDTFYAMESTDTIRAMGGNDVVQAGDGDDYLYGNAGNDVLDGGTGYDRAVYSGNSWNYTVTFDSASGHYTVADNLGGEGVDTLRDVEVLAFADSWRDPAEMASPGQTIIGTEFGDYLSGTFGADILQGLDGHDTLEGREGNDLLAGGNGTDAAFYRGYSWEYDLGWDAASGTYRITDHILGRDGTDTLSGVEYLNFADGQQDITLMPVTTVGMAEQPAEAFIA